VEVFESGETPRRGCPRGDGRWTRVLTGKGRGREWFWSGWLESKELLVLRNEELTSHDGEFDPGSERTLAARIKHASRTGSLGGNS
jgi:hypothetical protein